jgi:hypothetical protein
MSSSFHKFTKKVDPLGHALVEGVFGIEKQEKKIAAAKAAQDAELATRQQSDAALAEKMKVTQVGERRQELNERAAAAGATRSENDVQLLGASGGTSPRKRNASRTLLGE